MILPTAAKVYSILGNTKALTPLAVKDSANCLGLTTAAYITGKKEEAQDRFIDEVGTEGIWLGTIPLYKKIIDKTGFKIAKLDSKYDIRNLENPDIFEKTKQYAPTAKIAADIEKIGQNATKFKALNFVKVVAAIGMALASYDILTDLKQKYTEKKLDKKIREEMKREYSTAFMQSKHFISNKNNQTFKALSTIKQNKNKNISFKGGLSNVILDPVKNMYILDAGITGQRLVKSRDSQEFMGYSIKEFGFLGFMYCLGPWIQNFMVERAEKKHNKNIALDSRVLEDDNFKDLFKTGKIEESLNAFPEYSIQEQPKKGVIKKIKEFFNPPKLSQAEMAEHSNLYDYIQNNPENEVIKAAKKSDIIENYKVREKGIWGLFKKKQDTGKIDTRKYIDMNEIKNTHSNIKKLYSQYKASGEDIDVFFNKVRKLKRNSIKVNMASSMLALGVILPGMMLAKRILSNDTEFATEKRIREKIKNEQVA